MIDEIINDYLNNHCEKSCENWYKYKLEYFNKYENKTIIDYIWIKKNKKTITFSFGEEKEIVSKFPKLHIVLFNMSEKWFDKQRDDAVFEHVRQIKNEKFIPKLEEEGFKYLQFYRLGNKLFYCLKYQEKIIYFNTVTEKFKFNLDDFTEYTSFEIILIIKSLEKSKLFN